MLLPKQKHIGKEKIFICTITTGPKIHAFVGNQSKIYRSYDHNDIVCPDSIRAVDSRALI